MNGIHTDQLNSTSPTIFIPRLADCLRKAKETVSGD